MNAVEVQEHRDMHDLCPACEQYRQWGFCPVCGLENREADSQGLGLWCGHELMFDSDPTEDPSYWEVA